MIALILLGNKSNNKFMQNLFELSHNQFKVYLNYKKKTYIYTVEDARVHNNFSWGLSSRNHDTLLPVCYYSLEDKPRVSHILAN